MSHPDWTALPPLSALRAFEATARLGGFSAAARSLNVTPAAVAQQVRALETDVGAPLVRREGRGLTITAAGQQLATPLSEAFALIARGFATTQRSAAEQGVRVSTTEHFGNAVILPRMADFWRMHPGCQVSFTPDGNQAKVDFDTHDIVIRGGGPDDAWPGLRQIPLVRTPMIVSAAPRLLSGAVPDLQALPWIADTSLGPGVFDAILRALGCDPDRVTRVNPGNLRFDLDAQLLGYGLGSGPEVIVARHLADGRLTKLCEVPGISAVYSALVPTGPMSPQVARFLAWLRGICADLPGTTAAPPP